MVEVHPSALKHGVDAADIQHAIDNALTIEDLEDDVRLYLGPSRTVALLEVLTIAREDGSELAIHAMPMRAKYERLLPGAS